MLALGGQGGGVLTKWLVDTAEANGYLAQSTYIAGVAQRTGATVYCIEMFPADVAASIGKQPVFTPYPIPGDVDLVIAGEMAETGRAIEKGFVTPNVTTLIASSHRVYSVAEKSAMGDGILDQSIVAEVAASASKRFVCFDMQAAADEAGSVISSVLLGAIAATGALPFDRGAFEATIRGSGRAVEANLRGFALGFEGASRDTPLAAAPAEELPMATPEGVNGEALAARIAAELPKSVQAIALLGALRALDYQDASYADSYLDRVRDIASVDADAGGEHRAFALTAEVARQLALQMCYEDTIRVADLKTRRDRMRRVREQLAVHEDQPVRVVEYFHPRLEEVCDTLPAALGGFVSRSSGVQKLLAPFFRKGRTVATTSIGGFLLLYLLAKLQRFRRGTFRFGRQQAFIREWLDRIAAAAHEDYDYALSIAHCIEIVKGYGDTYARGLSRYRSMIDAVGREATSDRAQVVRRLHRAALADEQGRAFSDALLELEAAR